VAKRNERCNGCDDLAKVEKELKEARRRLATIAGHAEATATPAAAEMSRGDVPRGRWSYLKAQVETCNATLSIMGLPQVAIKQRRAMFGKGLFSGFLGRK
jgi:hypothetical protein